MKQTQPGEITGGTELWLVCSAPAEPLCGTEDVYGRLCEEACTAGTDRPYAVEGITLQLLPLRLRTALARWGGLNQRHLRSLVASAYYEDERGEIGNLILRAGLLLDTWCHGARHVPRGCVPLAVLARNGERTIFLDAWVARRERIEPPPPRHRAGGTAIRPWGWHPAPIAPIHRQRPAAVARGPPAPRRRRDP